VLPPVAPSSSEPAVGPLQIDPSVPSAPASDPSGSALPRTDSAEPIVRPAPRVRRLVVFTGRMP
jgi:hypothetical protein